MRTYLALAALSAAITACGDGGLGGGGLDTDVDRPSTLAVVRGSVTNAAGVGLEGKPRVAVLWHKFGFNTFEGAARSDYKTIGQDVELTPGFPAGFTINLTEPPPLEATLSRDEMIEYMDHFFGDRFPSRWAIGTLVVYDDRDGNGRLDLVAPEADAFVDAVVGVLSSRAIFWIEEPWPDQPFFASEGEWRPGFTWLDGADLGLTEQTIYPSFPLALNAGHMAWRPIEEPVGVELAGDELLDQIMCEPLPADRFTVIKDDQPEVGRGPAPPYRTPDVRCDPLDYESTKYMMYESKVQRDGVCPSSVTITETIWLRPDDVPPSDWPCNYYGY